MAEGRLAPPRKVRVPGNEGQLWVADSTGRIPLTASGQNQTVGVAAQIALGFNRSMQHTKICVSSRSVGKWDTGRGSTTRKVRRR
jgi:hypothetical protein